MVVDANVLLDLYRVTKHERDQVRDALDKVADRLWMPYQVGLEYQRGRMSVIKNRAGKYDSLADVPAEAIAPMASKVAGLGLSADVITLVDAMFKDLTEQMSQAVENFRDNARKLAAQHTIDPTTALKSDPVRDQLDDLFAGRVGTRPDPKVRDERIVEAGRRAADGVPPGYADSKKGDDERAAGDFLLWAEILDHARETEPQQRRFLFVTNDQKDDWFSRDSTGPVRPRNELVAEFANVSTHGYHQVTVSQFLTLARIHLQVTVGEDTIARADTLAEHDIVEQRQTVTSSLTPTDARCIAQLLQLHYDGTAPRWSSAALADRVWRTSTIDALVNASPTLFDLAEAGDVS